MATTQSHATDLITSEEQPANLDIMKEQPVSANNETSASFKSSHESAVLVHPAKVSPLTGPYGLAGDFAAYLPSSLLSPQAPGFYYRGEWDEYSTYVNVEALDVTSPVGFNENASLVYQTGYGYNPQMPYGSYSPAATPLPSEGQLYSPYYQQVVPPSMQYISSPTQPDLTILVGVDQQGDNIGPRPSYNPHPIGPFNGSQPSLGFDGGIWSDWSKPSDMYTHSSTVSPALSPSSFGSYGQNTLMGSQRERSFYGFGSGANSYNRGYMHSSGHSQGSNYGSRLVSNMGNQGWIGVDNIRARGRVSDPSLDGGYNGNYDILNEQNRGPRASKPKIHVSEELDSSAGTKKNNKDSPKEQEESNNNNNNHDFITDYNDAKLFIIKSYSEDNVHKSIKYNVWASTSNGNQKLDASYREAKDEKEQPCPVFLLFSVNASSQFCGVAEMIGPVDFDKSVDYWQQDKWSGQFPVKWHIVKDVPNSQFRHIILENNDNKPVTNSRDTQEVKLEQGIEMLKIFKNYDAETSILDDFVFYEEREKIIQERKARRQPNLPSAVGETEHKPASAALQTDFIKNMSKSFAQVVRLEGGSKASPDATTKTIAVSSGQSN